MTRISALVTSAPAGGISYKNIDLQVNNEAKAKLKPVYTGLCGTDRMMISGNLPFTYNPKGQDYIVIGHEAVCQVLDIEDNKFNIKSGDYVVPVVRRPGSCVNCRIGRPDNCSDADHDVIEAGVRGLNGFNSEYFYDFPQNLLKINDKTNILINVLTEPTKNVMKAFEIFDKVSERSIFTGSDSTYMQKNCVIIGTGSEAFLYAFMAKEYTMNVFMTNRHSMPEDKMKIIDGINASFFNYKNETMPDYIDLLIDTSGDPETIMRFIRKLNYNGVCILFGTNGAAPGTDYTGIDISYIVEHNIVIAGSVDGSKKHYLDAIKYLNKWKYMPGSAVKYLITGIFSPDETEIFMKKPIEEIKSVIKW
ncbi:alcohol dehydrogenase catalytic domain-containing protein [Ferroplasma sp.]|uniref:alcohol dehydrogenase catalytic domain-containing protein n=1 Tax=Ferroplasma sp. TaxID=2591003 RepID=UPI00307F56F9